MASFNNSLTSSVIMSHLFNVYKNGGVKMACFAFMCVCGGGRGWGWGGEWDYFLARKINFLESLLVD